MFTVILIVHCLLCLALIGLVLLQQGKGADAGATFGGSSNTVLGAGGADFITKLTTSLAIAFMVTSVILVRSYADGQFTREPTRYDPLAGSVLEGMPDDNDAPVLEEQPAEQSAAPQVEQQDEVAVEENAAAVDSEPEAAAQRNAEEQQQPEPERASDAVVEGEAAPQAEAEPAEAN